MNRIPIIRDINAIYIIKNTVNNKVYVGSSTNLRKRWNDHIRELNEGIHINDHLQKSWNHYGMESFDFLVVSVVEDSDELLLLEDYYINKYDSMNVDKGYNLISADRHEISNSTREKLSVAGKGRCHTEESKQKISQAKKGMVFTEEHRRKLSEAHKGKHLSKQSRKKVSEYQKSREWTPKREQQFLDAAEKAHKSLKGRKLTQDEINRKLQGRLHVYTCIKCGNTFETTGNTRKCPDCRK